MRAGGARARASYVMRTCVCVYKRSTISSWGSSLCCGLSCWLLPTLIELLSPVFLPPYIYTLVHTPFNPHDVHPFLHIDFLLMRFRCILEAKKKKLQKVQKYTAHESNKRAIARASFLAILSCQQTCSLPCGGACTLKNKSDEKQWIAASVNCWWRENFTSGRER